MTHLVLNGMIGLLLGISLHLCQTDDANTVRQALVLRRRNVIKALLWAMGSLAAMTALLMWLAVIDVDKVPVLPLTGRVLLGGVLAGASLGLAGFTPETAFAGVGGGRFTESLCAAVGCGVAWLLAPRLEGILSFADEWFQPIRATLFRVTLDEKHLLPGGFLAQGSIGLALCLPALFIPREKPAPAAPAPQEPAPPAEPVSIEPEAVQEETVVMALPGEEPVIVDTEEGTSETQEEDAPAQTTQTASAEDPPEPDNA